MRTRYITSTLHLERTTSLYSPHIARIPGLESLILFAVTAALPGLSNAAIGFLTTGLTALATTAVSVGLSALLAPPMPKPPKPADGKVPRTHAIPPVHFGVGTNRIAGAYMLWEAKGDFLYAVTALCGHKISAINAVYLHDDTVTIGGDDYVSAASTNDGRYSGRTWVQTRLGLSTETAYDLIVDDLSPEGIWTANHRGDGTASLGMMCRAPNAEHFQKLFPHGSPQPSVAADLALVWDFRDPLQDPEDESTWEFSRNPALCLAWWLCFCPYGPKWDYTKAILPVQERWEEEADICDEPIDRAAGGTEPRYEVNGWATTETDPIGILNSFLAACDGHLAQHGDGTLVLTVGKFREELVETITDADIVGHFIQYDVPEEDEVNRLVPRFTYPATDYSTAVADYIESAADQAKVGRVLSAEADLSWVHNWRQAKRLTLREWRRLQQKKSGNFDLRLSAINAIHARWVRVESTYRIPSLNDVIIENRRSILALMQGGFQMEWKKHPTDIDAWTPATDEGAAPPIPAKPTQNELTTPTIDTVTAVSNGSSVYIRVVILEPPEADVTPLVRYRIKDIGGGTPGAWIEQPFPDAEPSAGLVTLNTNPVPSDELLEVQAAVKATGGTVSDWSTPIVEVTSTVDTVAPQDLVAFTLTGSAPYLGNAPFSFTTQNDDHLKHVALYRVASGGVLDRETDLVLNIPVNTAASTYAYVDGDATVTNLAINPGFDTDTDWTKPSDVTISAGTANKVPGGANRHLYQAATPPLITSIARWQMDVLNYVAGSFLYRISNGTTAIASSSGATANGTYRGTLANGGAGANRHGPLFGSTAEGSVDNVVFYWETASCAPQGVWDYYAEPLNPSGVAGSLEGPVTVTII